MIDELYLHSYANEPNKSPWRERLRDLLPLRETATFPPQADHVLVVFFFIRGGNGGLSLSPPTCDIAKAVRGKFIVIQTYQKKVGMFQINNLILHLHEMEEHQQT